MILMLRLGEGGLLSTIELITKTIDVKEYLTSFHRLSKRPRRQPDLKIYGSAKEVLETFTLWKTKTLS